MAAEKATTEQRSSAGTGKTRKRRANKKNEEKLKKFLDDNKASDKGHIS